MKKLLLILSLVASAASISAMDSGSASDDGLGVDTSEKESVKPRRFQAVVDRSAKVIRAVKQSDKVKFFTEKHPVASKRAGYVVVGAVVIVAAKKAYDRYKVWKNKKADKTATKEEVTA